MSTEKKFDPRLREGDRVRLVQDVEAERRTYRVGELATILELPSHSKELVDSWELMDMYDIICDEGGIVGVLSKSIERVPGRSTVQYGPDGEVSVQLPDLASMGHGAIALKDGDRVELVTDIKVGGTPHSVGTAGFVVIKDLGPDAIADLKREDRYTIVLDKGGLIVVPRFVLELTAKPGPTRL